MTRSTPATATTSPYRFRRPETCTAAAAAAGSPAAAGGAGPGSVIIRLCVPRLRAGPQCVGCRPYAFVIRGKWPFPRRILVIARDHPPESAEVFAPALMLRYCTPAPVRSPEPGRDVGTCG